MGGGSQLLIILSPEEGGFDANHSREERIGLPLCARLPGIRHALRLYLILLRTNNHVSYRVTPVVSDLGWVDLDFECSTVCPTVFGLVENWPKWLGN